MGGSVLTRQAIRVLVVAAIAFAVYSNTLLNGFVDDDEAQVLRNPWIKDVRFIPDIFSRSVWSFLRGAAVSNYYRPLMHLIYLVSYHIFGFQAWGFHLVNVLFHVANTIVVFLLTARLTGVSDERGAQGHGHFTALLLLVPFVAALLFATHPVHTEAVAWIAALPELSFTLLYLLSFHLYVAPAPRPATRVLPSAALFFLALLCKETALTLPALFLVYDAAFRRNQRSASEYLVRYAPYLVAAAVYLTLRYHVLSQTLVPVTRLWNLSSYELAINVFPLFSEYAGKLFLPIHLNFWHSFHPISSLLTREGALSLVVVATFLAAASVSWRKRRLAFLSLSLFAIPLSPAFYVNALSGKPFAERYLYLPSVGFVILVALFLCGAATVKRMRITAIVTILVSAALYSAATVSRNRVWKNAYTLFSDTVSKAPDAPIPRYDLAIALFNQGRVDEAMEHYQILVKAHPDDVHYQSALGAALLQKGRLHEAIEHLKTALSLAPDSLDSYNDLGIALRRRGDVQEAIGQYRKALAIDPEYADAHFNLGSALADTGELNESMEHYRAAVRLRPESDYYRNVLGIECGKLGLLDEAIEQFQEAVRLAPSEPAYRRNLDRAMALKQSAQAHEETTK